MYKASVEYDTNTKAGSQAVELPTIMLLISTGTVSESTIQLCYANVGFSKNVIFEAIMDVRS